MSNATLPASIVIPPWGPWIQPSDDAGSPWGCLGSCYQAQLFSSHLSSLQTPTKFQLQRLFAITPARTWGPSPRDLRSRPSLPERALSHTMAMLVGGNIPHLSKTWAVTNPHTATPTTQGSHMSFQRPSPQHAFYIQCDRSVSMEVSTSLRYYLSLQMIPSKI